MIIKPVSKGFICLTAHPEGCAENVREQIAYVRARGPISGPRRVLVIGASTGYGLASRVVSTFGLGADTLGVFFERPADGKRTATAGWYNTAAFEREAARAGRKAVSLNGDAFSEDVKNRAIESIKKDLGGPVDLVVYSLASPRRVHPRTGETFQSTLKPIGKPFQDKTVNFHNGQVSSIALEPASEEEIRHTEAVMGGEDWEMWIDALDAAGALAPRVATVAYSYIGPEVTMPIYRDGTIGRAKDHLEAAGRRLDQRLRGRGGRAVVSVNKALVTQASAAIPVVPLYIALLFKVMKAQGLHEGCIEQIDRLFRENLFASAPPPVDERGRVRIDDRELRPDVQREVHDLWNRVGTDNIATLGDLEGYRAEFFKLFGFGAAEVDYDRDVDPAVEVPSLADPAPAR